MEADAKLVMAWRNDVTSLAMFYHHEPKQWPDFLQEFRHEYFKVPQLPPVFIMSGDVPVGFMRFQPINPASLNQIDVVDISINVDPVHRGQGCGLTALTEVVNFLKTRGVKRIESEVRIENTASQHLFERAGYEFDGETHKLIEDSGELCHIRRYHLNLDETAE